MLSNIDEAFLLSLKNEFGLQIHHQHLFHLSFCRVIHQLKRLLLNLIVSQQYLKVKYQLINCLMMNLSFLIRSFKSIIRTDSF